MSDSQMTVNHIGPENKNAQHAPRRTILSVDRSEANRYLRSRILRAAGYEVIEADKGSDALSLAAEKQPCLILLDIQLPDMNGFAVCRRLKANPRTAPIPVLHVSSLGRRDHSYPEALESGADAYLREPVQASVLLAVITALVRAASAEARERKTERLAVDILESIGEAMYLLDQDYRFTYVNAEAERLLGFDRSALLGKTHGQVFPDSAAPRVDREFRRVMTERTASFFENYYKPEEKWYEIKASPVSGGGIAVHFRDVTGRKQAEETRQRLVADLRERTAAVAETALFPEQNPQPILRIRGDGILLYANSSSIGLLADWNCAVGHSVPGFLRQAVEGARTEGAVKELEIEVNGREYSFLITPIKDAAYANLYGRDITARKLAEQGLRESEERFRSVAENMSEGLMVFDAQGDFTYQNPASQRIHGFGNPAAGNVERDTLRAAWRNWDETGRPLSFERWPISRVLRGERFQDQILCATSVETNREFHASYNGCPMVDANGRLMFGFVTIREITEQRKAETAVRESEERLRFALASCQIGAWDLDLVDHTAYRSLEHARIFGYNEPLPQWTLDDFLKHALPEYRAEIETIVREATAAQRGWTYECRIRRADGEMRWIWLTGRHRFDTSGRPRVVGVVQDITERKQAEERLFDTNQRLRALMDALPVGVSFSDDPTCQRITGNQAVLEQFEVGPEDNLSASTPDPTARGRQVRFLHEGREMTAAELPLQLAVKHGRVIPAVELEVRLPSGRTWFAEGSGAPVCDRSGNVVGGVAVTVDITERRRSEEALRESEERFHTLADNIAQLAWMAHGDGRVFWYNQRWHEYAGTPAGNARPFEADGAVHPEHAHRVATRLHQSFQTGGPWEDMFPLRGSDGQYRWFLGRALPVRHGTEQVVRWLGTCTDITAQKRTEAALRRSNNDLQQFAYIATHDLREPLRNIATFAELLDRSIKGDIANVAPGRCIDVITGAARRMEALITSVLTYARITADTAHSTGMVDANSALAEALAALQTGIAESGADVTRDELPAIEGDRMLIVQLFQNLVSNSIKYRLASVPPQIHVGVGRRVDEWLFTVRDNGQGFKPEYAERIFGMFKRLHGDEIAGTGIGLAICKAVVERHGGQIWAEARPGEGATFYFTIPSAAG